MALALGGLPSLASESGSDPAESNHTTAESLQDMLQTKETPQYRGYCRLQYPWADRTIPSQHAGIRDPA